MRFRKTIPILTSLIACLGTATAASLNIIEYLNHADADCIYPSAEQQQMLNPFIPTTAFMPSPSINDRTHWNNLAASHSGKTYLAEAETMLNKKPEIPISDERYRKARKTGDRTLYKPRYYDTMSRLEYFMLAECLENKGRFIPQINTYLQAIMDMKSWLHPNHDPNCLVLDGKKTTIDLGARLFGSDLALAEVLLGDRLSPKIRKEIPVQLRRRIIEPYLKSCRGENGDNNWIRGSSNWNSVCTSGSLFVIIALSAHIDERSAAVGCALNSMKYYLAGFGDDGYCSEGIGYWGYGFGHYLYLAQTLYDYSAGSIDLFKFDNPDKLAKIAVFPENFHIQHGIFPAFSDSNITNPSDFANFGRAMTATHFGTKWTYNPIHEHAIEQLVQWRHLAETPPGTGPHMPAVSYFDDRGIIISRGSQPAPLSIAFKAGDNAENHNHSDVGSYFMILGNDLIAGDIGKPVYIAGAFSPKNKSRSSWGHPVPRIDGTLQANGSEFYGKIIKTEFTENVDRVVMDIRPAYDFQSLETLCRTLENEKSGLGSITIEDQFTSSKPIEFGTAITTYAKIELLDEKTILLTTENKKVRVEIASQDAPFTIKTEPVPVQLMSHREACRIGIDFKNPAKKGSIQMRFQPLAQ